MTTPVFPSARKKAQPFFLPGVQQHVFPFSLLHVPPPLFMHSPHSCLGIRYNGPIYGRIGLTDCTSRKKALPFPSSCNVIGGIFPGSPLVPPHPCHGCGGKLHVVLFSADVLPLLLLFPHSTRPHPLFRSLRPSTEYKRKEERGRSTLIYSRTLGGDSALSAEGGGEPNHSLPFSLFSLISFSYSSLLFLSADDCYPVADCNFSAFA